MLRIDLTTPLLNLVIERRSVLGRKDSRVWNRDRSLRDVATALAIEKYETENAAVLAAVGDESEESGLMRFLNWLIDHQEEIKSLIQMIMSLFMTSKTVSKKIRSGENDVL